MITPDFIQKQVEHLEHLKTVQANLNKTFEENMRLTLQKAPEKDKANLLKVQQVAKKAFDLAKSGKVDEAINITQEMKKSFNNGR